MTTTSPASDDLPDGLVRYFAYFAQRETDRAAAVAELLSGLTERELLLVKEAAVMGWVQGMRHHDLEYPGDRQALFTVVDACRSFADLYPTITTPAPAASTALEG